MTILSTRLPMIPRLTATDGGHTVQHYLGWHLLETDQETSDILICKSCAASDRTRAKDLVILGDALAAAWMKAMTAPVG